MTVQRLTAISDLIDRARDSLNVVSGDSQELRELRYALDEACVRVHEAIRGR